MALTRLVLSQRERRADVGVRVRLNRGLEGLKDDVVRKDRILFHGRPASSHWLRAPAHDPPKASAIFGSARFRRRDTGRAGAPRKAAPSSPRRRRPPLPTSSHLYGNSGYRYGTSTSTSRSQVGYEYEYQTLVISVSPVTRENRGARATEARPNSQIVARTQGNSGGGGTRSVRVRVPYREISIEYKQKWQLQGIGGGDYGETVKRRKGKPEKAKRET